MFEFYALYKIFWNLISIVDTRDMTVMIVFSKRLLYNMNNHLMHMISGPHWILADNWLFKYSYGLCELFLNI